MAETSGGEFPTVRLRRLRRPGIRDLVRETRLDPADFIAPLFVDANLDAPRAVASMPGVSRLPVEAAAEEAAAAFEDGVRAFLLFGVPEHKDERGSASWDDDGVVQRAVRRLREAVPGPW
jgi:porphobilinogen synthase